MIRFVELSIVIRCLCVNNYFSLTQKTWCAVLELNQPKEAHMAPNPQQRILLHINLVGVVGVEPTLFTTWDRIYSPEQNTPYLQHTLKLYSLHIPY